MLKDKGDISYLWKSAYSISELLKSRIRNENSQAYKVVSNIMNGIVHHEMGSERFLDLVAISAKWAELESKYNKFNEVILSNLKN